MNNQEGILDIIRELIDDSDELRNKIDPLIGHKKTDEQIENIESILQIVQNKLHELHDKVNVSHDLIQTVIISIHSSRNELKKSVDGLIKKTGMQLKKITSTTEEATNKILDIAEKLDDDQMTIIDIIDKLKEETSDGLDQSLEKIKEKVLQNQDAAFTIIDYLQFQDITAQQIAGAYSLLSDTEKTLVSVSNLLKEFDMNNSASDDSDLKTTGVDKKSFNMEAAYSDKKNLQKSIDEMFSSGNTDTEIPEEKQKVSDLKDEDMKKKAASSGEKVDDSDINDLFSQKKEKESKDEKEEDFDIDELFSKKKKSEKKNEDEKDSNKSTQEDIDELFSKK